MPKTAGSKDFPPDRYSVIMRMWEAGQKITQIARTLLMDRSTVGYIIKRGGQKSPKPGRSPKVTPHLSRRITREAQLNPRMFATEITNLICPELSSQTVRNQLHKSGLKSRVARRKPDLTDKHKRDRLKFAHEHIGKPLSFWEKVLWTDESKIVSKPNPRRKVWRPVGRALDPRYVNGTQKGRTTTIMVHGTCSSAGVGTLELIESIMTARVYVDVIQSTLYASKFKLGLPDDWLFMQDNDPKHTAGLTDAWLDANEIKKLNWPANSPDLNPIEHLWEVLKRCFLGTGQRSKEAVFAAVKNVWEEIPPQTVANLVASMPDRLKAVIEAHGGHTKY